MVSNAAHAAVRPGFPEKWPLFAGAAALLTVTALLLARVGGDGGVRAISDLAQLVTSFAAAAGTALAGARRSGRLRASWFAVSAGCACWAFGQAVYSWYELIRNVDSPFPSIADFGYLLFGVGATAGLLLMPTDERVGARVRALLDGLIAASALVVVSWAFSLGTVAHASDGGSLSFAISLAYPLEDIVVITLAISCVSRPTRYRAQLAVLGAAFSAFALSDSAYVYLTAHDLYRTGGPTDLGWIGAFLLIAATGMFEARREAAPVQLPADVDRRPAPTTMLPYLPVAAAAALLGVRRAEGHDIDSVQLIAIAFTMAAVLLRQWMTVRQNRALLDEIAESERKLQTQAFSDQLTGLANRALFLNRVEHALELHRRDMRAVSVLFCDLDDFKAINDTLGHAAGDELLIRVAQRLVGTVRGGDTVARLGGDEFAVLLEDGGQPELIGTRMVEALRPAFQLANDTVLMRVSVGLAEVAEDQVTPTVDLLLAQADVAMYSAKRAGKGRLASYRDGMALPDVDGVHLRQPLARAIQHRAIEVHYQPIVAVETGAVLGFEALARWTHEGVAIAPDVFIPMATRSGLIRELTDHVLDSACAQLASWQVLSSRNDLFVSVNVAPETIKEIDFCDQVARALRNHQIGSRGLVLEITEDALLDDAVAVTTVTRRLRELGVALSLDDFGKGYSSLVHLQQLPLRSLKIDRAFTAEIDTDPSAERFLAALVTFGRDLQLVVVAEGIERPSQHDVLRRLGCPTAQGFLYGRPSASTQIELAASAPR